MPRPRSSGSVIHHTAGRRTGRLSIRVPLDGRMVERLMPPGTTERQAYAAIERLTALAPAAVRGGRIKLADWIAEWLGRLEERVSRGERSPNTLRTYREHSRTWLLPLLGERRLEDLSVRDVRGFVATMRRRGCSERLCRDVLTCLRVALRAAMRDELIARNVAGPDYIETPTVRPQQPPALTTEAGRAILAAVRGEPHELIAVLALTAGLRRGELAGLRWTDIDWQARTAAITRQRRQAIQGSEIGPPKGRRGRVVGLPAEAIDALEHERERQAIREAAYPGYRRSGFVVVNQRNGAALAPGGVADAWRQLAKKAGVQAMRLHDLRHGWSTLARRAGVDDLSRQRILGHRDLVMTAHYSGTDASDAQAAAEKLSRLLREG